MAADLRVEVITSIDDLEGVVEAWGALHEASPRADLFNGPAWVMSWLESYWLDRPVSFRLVWRGGTLVGVVPLVHDTDGMVWCPGFHVTPVNLQTPRMDVLTEACGAGVMDAVLSDEVRRDRRVHLAFKSLPSDSMPSSLVKRQARANGLQVVEKAGMSSPVVEADGGWSEYVATRPKKLRREMRRKRRNFERQPGATWRVVRRLPDVRDAMERVMEIERASWKEQEGTSLTSERGSERFYRSLAGRLAARGELRIDLLELEGRPIAHLLGARLGDVVFGLKTSYAMDVAGLSPGAVLFGYALEDCLTSGVRVVELLGVTAPWKEAFATGSRGRTSLCLFSPGLTKCAWCWLKESHAKPFLRSAAPTLVDLRRAMKGSDVGRVPVGEPRVCSWRQTTGAGSSGRSQTTKKGDAALARFA